MYFDPETNTYTSDSPADRQRRSERDTRDLEKRIKDLERRVSQLEGEAQTSPPPPGIRRSGSLK